MRPGLDYVQLIRGIDGVEVFRRELDIVEVGGGRAHAAVEPSVGCTPVFLLD
jgi:hypothetical protein